MTFAAMRDDASQASARSKIAVMAVAAVVFFVVGFFLPRIIMWAAMSIPSVQGLTGPVESSDAPLSLSLLVGAMMSVGAVIGLGKAWAEAALSKRRTRSD